MLLFCKCVSYQSRRLACRDEWQDLTLPQRQGALPTMTPTMGCQKASPHSPLHSLGLQPPPEKMVGVGLGGLTTEPEEMVGALGIHLDS